MITTTGMSGRVPRTRSQRSRPPISGMLRSVRTTSKSSSATSSSASCADVRQVTLYWRRKIASRNSQALWSSSTIRSLPGSGSAAVTGVVRSAGSGTISGVATGGAPLAIVSSA